MKKKSKLRKAVYPTALAVLAGALFVRSLYHKKRSNIEDILNNRTVVKESLVDESKRDIVSMITDPLREVIVYEENGKEYVITEKGNKYSIGLEEAKPYYGTLDLVARTKANKNVKTEELYPLARLAKDLNMMREEVERKYGMGLIELLKKNEDKVYVFKVEEKNFVLHAKRLYLVPEKINNENK